MRAKRKIQEIRPPFEVPSPAELPAALDSVLEALYLMFNEGYAASAGDELVRQDVCAEAIRLARLVAEHPCARPAEGARPRRPAPSPGGAQSGPRRSEGNLLLLSEQDRALWDREKLAAGLHHLDQAARGTEMSAFHLEAGIAAAHAMAPSDEATDWPYILSLYDSLLALKGSPVVALNRAVALAMAKARRPGSPPPRRSATTPPSPATIRSPSPWASSTPAPATRSGPRTVSERPWRRRARSRCGGGFRRGC